MLFLDFLWIFVFIEYLNARPIFKSMTKNIAGINVSMLHNKDLIKINQDYNSLDSEEKHTDRYGIKHRPIRESKNNVILRRKIACKKSNGFDKYYKKYGDYRADKEVKNNTRGILQSTKTDGFKKEFNIEDISTTPSLLDISILENSNNFFGMSSPQSTNNDTEFLSTAEIEAVLNEIEHREIQMIAGHEPSLANLITNTIIQTTYSSILDSKAYTNENKYTSPRGNKNTKNKLLNHLFQRSIKEECSTLAQNIENKLQKQIKNVFKRVKNKLSHDYNKEIKNTKDAAKQKFEQITNKFCNSTKMPNKDLNHHPFNATVANSRNTCSAKKLKHLHKNKSTCSTASSHTISTLGDEFAILTIIEKILSKGQENSVINMFTTTRNFVKKVERSSKLNQNNSRDDKDIYFDVQEYPNKNLDIENKIRFHDTVTTNGHELSDQSDATTEDTSFEALSNKLSYNDYVNGYKYYLNYQKTQDDNKFSNLIRYQAHKHHNVDDIGKFILNKIPQLPTTRYKRHFVESETLEDQDVSTKSEDSWFKRHFFIYVDADSPKQFHSTQTVTCKNSILHSNNGNNTFLHKKYMKKRENLNYIRNHRHSLMLSNNKVNSSFDKDITPHSRSMATVMIQKEKGRKCLRPFQLFHRKPNQKHKREDRFRTQRFDIFKGIKDTFKYQPKYSRERQEKILNYEIMSSPQQYYHFNIKKFHDTHEMIKQVPNISANFEFPFPVLDLKNNKLNEYSLKYPKDNSQEFHFQNKPDDQEKSIIDCAQRRFLISTVKQNQLHPFKLTTPINHQGDNNRNIQININDVINEHLKTDLSQENVIHSVTGSTMYKNIESDHINSNYRTKLILPKIQKPNNMNSNIHLDNYNIITLKKSDPFLNIKVGSNPLKDSHLADKVTEMYYTNLITTDSIHKLHEKDMQFKNKYKNSRNNNLRNAYNFGGSIKSSTNSVVNKVINISNVKDTSANTLGRLYSTYLLKSTKFAQNMDKSLQEYGNTLHNNNYTNSNDDRVMNKYYNTNITFTENLKEQPKQYFMTPLPMKMEDLNKFLKDHQIDVESVTAPIKYPLPSSASIIDKWKLNKNDVRKALNKTFLPHGKQGNNWKFNNNFKLMDIDF